MRIYHTAIYGLSGSTSFVHLISWQQEFRKMGIEHKVSDFLYNFCLKHFVFYEEVSKIWSKIYIDLYVKYPLFLSDFNEGWIFSTYFRKIHKYQISWKSVHWELSCSMRTDGQADVKNLAIAFRNFAKELKRHNGLTTSPLTTIKI